MAENFVNVTEGSGKKLHTWNRTIGANDVHDEFTIPGEYPLPSYVAVASSVAITTANDHVMTINGIASGRVRIRRIFVEQAAAATTAAMAAFQILRTTTGAPTGGTAITPAPYDTADAAAGAVCRTLPAVKGTESTLLATRKLTLTQTVATAGGQIPSWTWEPADNINHIVIPAGTTNGVCVKVMAAYAAAAVSIHIEFVETTF